MTSVSSLRDSGDLRPTGADPLAVRARTVWGEVDFHVIAQSFAEGARAFVARLGLRHEERVLDVACGTGNLALPAARGGARVAGVDIAPNLIAHARLEAIGMTNAEFEVGNAEALPYGDRRFDTVMSMFGVMFAYRQELAAAELARVTRKGGRIALANWTPEGFVGELLRAHTAVVPPPAGIASPLRWGSAESVRDLLGERVTALTCTRRTLLFRFPFGPAKVSDTFATYYGPTVMTLRHADVAGKQQLRDAITTLFYRNNTATDGTTVVEAEYLDVQARVI